jgi:hypothetical protein
MPLSTPEATKGGVQNAAAAAAAAAAARGGTSEMYFRGYASKKLLSTPGATVR